MITCTDKPSYSAKGRRAESYQDLLIDLNRVKPEQPDDREWVGSSDHTLIMYVIKDTKVMKARKRISKTTLAKKWNKEEVAECYSQTLGNLVDTIKSTKTELTQDAYECARKVIVEPWELIVRRRPNIRTPHWNFNLNNRWKEMRKARNRANRSRLRVDWEI